MLDGLANLATSNSKAPKPNSFAKYLFFTMGISEAEFNKCSMPYIMEMLSVHNYVKKEEEKAAKKANRKR